MNTTFANFAVFALPVFFVATLVLAGVIKVARKNFREIVTQRDSYRKSSGENFNLYAAESNRPEHVLCRVIGVKFGRYEQDDVHYGYYVWLGVKTSPEGVTTLLPTNRNIFRLENSQLPSDYLGCPKWHYITSLSNSIVMLGETYTLLDEEGSHRIYCKTAHRATIPQA